MKLFDKLGYTELTRDLVMGMQIHTTLSSLRRAIGSDEAIIVEATETMPTLYYVKEVKDGEILGYWIHSCAVDLVQFLLLSNPGLASEVKSVEDLQAALAEGGKVMLSADVVVTEPLNVEAGSESVLDLQNHSISNEEDMYDLSANNWSLIQVKGGKLTIDGEGDVVAKENDCYAVDVRDGGEVTINGGNFNGNITAVYVHDGIAYINGGTFKVQQTDDGKTEPYALLLNCLDANYKDGTANIVVTGGKFYNFDPANCKAEGDATNFVAEGYESVEVEEGVWEVRAIA